jgi:DNA polymerase I-like protein with 3'-5' exonuclease and polymerase domains
LDCYNTLLATLALLEEFAANPYAVRNYQEKFPLTTPAIWSAMHGFAVDTEIKDAARRADDEERATMQADLNVMCGGDIELNVASPLQVKNLLYGVLGARPIRGKGRDKTGKPKTGTTDELTLSKISTQHPIIRVYCELVTAIRKKRKAIGTYYDALLLRVPNNCTKAGYTDRLLWSYRIDGTKSERLSCKQSNFGPNDDSSYGAQVQNVPRYLKEALTADEGYTMFAKDYKQSEARCVAYLSDDKELIRAFEESDLTDDGDFYNECGWMFFGIPAESVPKALRNKVIKKIIHGSNYMMKGQTFVDNAGAQNLADSMHTLSIMEPRIAKMSILRFGNYLLGLYHKAYPNVREWYKSITVMLRTGAVYESLLGYTHRHFDDPYSDTTLRFAVSLQPQNLSVHLINRSVVRIFWEIQVQSNGEFKYIAQVHDENLQQCRVGTEDKYEAMVEAIMHQPVKFPTGETMAIPMDGNRGKNWMECH